MKPFLTQSAVNVCVKLMFKPISGGFHPISPLSSLLRETNPFLQIYLYNEGIAVSHIAKTSLACTRTGVGYLPDVICDVIINLDVGPSPHRPIARTPYSSRDPNFHLQA